MMAAGITVRQRFQTVFHCEPSCFVQLTPSSDDFTEMSFFTSFHPFFVFYNKIEFFFTSYVYSSLIIYIYYLCPHYVYVPQHFSVNPMYSRNGPIGKPCSKVFYLKQRVIVNVQTSKHSNTTTRNNAIIQALAERLQNIFSSTVMCQQTPKR